MIPIRPKEYSCTLSSVERMPGSPELAIFRLDSRGEGVNFVPGQCMQLFSSQNVDGAGRPVRRLYSIASSPLDAGRLEFYIKEVKEEQVNPADRGRARLTPYLFNKMNQGDECRAFGPMGHDTLIESDRDIVLVSSGTGIAPHVSIVRTLFGAGSKRKVLLIHGVKWPTQLAYRAELEKIAAKMPNFTYMPTVSQTPEKAGWPTGTSWEGTWGRAESTLGKVLQTGQVKADPARTEFYSCGVAETVDNVEALLRPFGYTRRLPSNPNATMVLDRYTLTRAPVSAAAKEESGNHSP